MGFPPVQLVWARAEGRATEPEHSDGNMDLPDQSQQSATTALASVGHLAENTESPAAEPDGSGDDLEDVLDDGSLIGSGGRRRGPGVPRAKMGTPPSAALPRLAKNATAGQETFAESVRQEAAKVYTQGSTDPDELLALRSELDSNPDLTGLGSKWGRAIDEAVARTAAQKITNGPVRQLIAAFAEARYAKKLRIIVGIDVVACREALALVYELDDASVLDMVVTVPDVGHHSFVDWEMTCEDSHAQVLKKRSFPKVQGKKKIRRQLKYLYEAGHEGSKVTKISTQNNWKTDPENPNRKTLSGTVGVVRQQSFPEDPCVMEEVVAEQVRSGRRWNKTCCEIRSSVAIACKKIN